MTMPETTTPTETRVSASICRKAPWVLRSWLRLRSSKSVVRPLMRIPAPAVQEMTAPFTSTGCSSLPILSTMMAPTATSRRTALVREISTDILR